MQNNDKNVIVTVKEIRRKYFLEASVQKKIVFLRFFHTKYFAQLCANELKKRLVNDNLFRVRVLNKC